MGRKTIVFPQLRRVKLPSFAMREVSPFKMALLTLFTTLLHSLLFNDCVSISLVDAFARSTTLLSNPIRERAVTRMRREGMPWMSSSSFDSDANNCDTTNQPHIVILGGGFGGINTALTLPTLPWSDTKYAVNGIHPKITLIDKSERFVFLPLLYELCMDDASLDEVAPTFKSLLRDGRVPAIPGLPGLPDLFDNDEKKEDGNEISFLQAKVEGIDVKNQQVVISPTTGSTLQTIDYDALVIATGAEISLDGIPGASNFALPFYTVDQSLELKRRLALLDSYIDTRSKNGDDQSVNIVVVGGGYSGVELALNLADRFDQYDTDVQVTLVHRGKRVLEYATEHNRKTGSDRLSSAGVNVMTLTSVVEVTAHEKDNGSTEISSLECQRCTVKLRTLGNSTNLADGDTITSLHTDLLLWTAGATPTSSLNQGIRNSILPRDVMGRILTSPTLNVPEYPNVFAIGDCSRPKKTPYPGTAQVAIQMATVAAWNVYATLANQKNDGSISRENESVKLLPFTYLNLGEMLTLGRNDATISTFGGIEIDGPGASWLRRLIYAVRMPTARQRLSAAVDGTGRKLARGALAVEKNKREG
ncbi:hypothetical protein ACHAW6_010929 [Cyclotella cf. meneghiniana]